MAASSYNCSQTELYTTSRNAWLLCQQFLPQFAGYKSKYSLEFIAENLALISTVEAMDDFEARTAPIKELRKDLVSEKADAASLYVRLRGYVADAFKDNKTALEAKYTEMGQTYFEKLSYGNSENVKGLFSSMVPFIRNHQEVLLKNGYMPKTFLTSIEEKQKSFLAAHETWQTGNKAKPNASEAKVIANNDLKARVMTMLSDGQAAFYDNKPIARKFVWTTILAPVRGVNPTGLMGRMADKATEAPLSNGTATIESLNLTVVCDKDGRYQFPITVAGKFAVTYQAEGYQTLVVKEKEIKMGVMSRLNVAMEAIV